ncbi:MAG TPA: hypothetical protein VHO07_20695 [Streptosporangiaceae bacterium]|jgi:hypothetical protein|nr:hypothetical protein [Streptosporangiaceae bacterium]HEX2822569.1 hypothetical protein [Streptosporangiaceae bacterium]
MLISAAVCPHPPFLVPEASGAPGSADAELDRLRAACHAAVATLTAERPDVIAVVGGAAQTAQYPPQATGSLREFGIPFTVGEDSQRPPVLPLSLTIGRWLLSSAPLSSGPLSSDGAQARTLWGIRSGAPAAECLDLGDKLAALAPRVALLAMGDGPGRRARGVPGTADAAADRYDAQVAAALAAPSPRALAALDPDQDDDLFIAGRAAWQVLAGAAGHDDYDAVLAYAGAPFEVTYFVATWHRAH